MFLCEWLLTWMAYWLGTGPVCISLALGPTCLSARCHSLQSFSYSQKENCCMVKQQETLSALHHVKVRLRPLPVQTSMCQSCVSPSAFLLQEVANKLSIGLVFEIPFSESAAATFHNGLNTHTSCLRVTKCHIYQEQLSNSCCNEEVVISHPISEPRCQDSLLRAADAAFSVHLGVLIMLILPCQLNSSGFMWHRGKNT